jgi:hypothetical protein
MAASKASGKAAVLEWAIDVVVRIVAPAVMPDPSVTAGVNVRRVGMALLVTEGSRRFLACLFGAILFGA